MKASSKRFIILTLTVGLFVFIGVTVFAVVFTDTYASSPNAAIPDANPIGGGANQCTTGSDPGTPVVSTLDVPDTGTIQDVQVGINISHSWIGDLRVTLTSPSGTTVLLFNDIDNPICGCRGIGEINSTFTDTGGPIDSQCTTNGVYSPDQPLSTFIGEEVNGTWSLSVTDTQWGDTGTLVSWSLDVTYDVPPTPINTPLSTITTVPGPTTTAPAPTSTPAPGLIVPNLGTVMIYRSQAQPVYQSPGGGVIRDAAGNELWLPSDSNVDGFDTYTVTDLRRVDDEMWVGLFLGSGAWGWVPLVGVTPLSYFPGAETASETAAESNGETK